jgi:WD40 repeat protein/predicted Ser/Thr protein kinase
VTPEEFERVRQLFLGAAELPPAARGAFLDRNCAREPAVRSEVEALLAQDEHGERVLDAPPHVVELRSALDDSLRLLESEPAPERIGRYTVLSTLGRGGMGVVYLAEQENPRRKVAVKIVHAGGMSPAMLRRFQQEASILGQLAHPGIAQIYEAGVATVRWKGGMVAQWPFLAMEYVRGETLLAYVERSCRDTNARLVLLASICDAVQHAHQRGVVHRDLKPGNILVNSDGQVKVLDFGIARLTNSDVQTATLQTEVGSLIGTLPYMSPEQVSGVSDEIDTRSDVYALGVIGYELLAGQLPYDVSAHSIPEAIRVIRETPPSHLSRIQGRFRGDLDTIVHKALEKDRARRYQSASELAADLRNYLARLPIAARPPTTFYQLRMFARRNKALVGGVFATILALLLGAVGFSLQANRATRGWNHARQAGHLAEQRRELAERRAYIATVIAAQAALTANDVGTSRERLEEAPPHLRNWEWWYLAAQLDASAASIAAHEDYVWSVAYGPTGEWLVSASADGTAKIWNTATGHLIRTLDVDEGTIRGIAISPDGGRVVTASYSGTLDVWDAATGALLMSLDGHTGPIHDVAYSPDGALIASAAIDGTARIWDARTGAGLAVFEHPSWVHDVCFTSDSTRLATTCRDNVVRIWSLSSGSAVLEIDVLPTTSEWDFVHCWESSFSPDARVLAAGGHDGVIRLYDAQTGDLLRVLAGHSERVRALVFSADGTLLASGSDDGTVRVWDPATGVQIAKLLGHQASVFAVAFSPDDAHVASASADHTVRIWDARGGAVVTSIVGHENRGMKTLDVSPDGRQILSGGYDGTIGIWDAASGQSIQTLRGHTGWVRQVQFSSDGGYVVSGSSDGTVRVWNANTGQEVAGLAGHTGAVEAVTFLPDGRIASAATDGTVRIWDLAAHREVRRLEERQEQFTALARSPNGNEFAVGTASGHLIFWELPDGARSPILDAHGGRIWELAYTPDGARVVSAADDGTLQVRAAADGQLEATLRGHDGPVRAVTLSPDGSRIASVALDRSLRVWDTATLDTVLSFRAHRDWPFAVKFSPDGSWLVSGGKSIRIWRTISPDEWNAKRTREPSANRQPAP